MKLSKPLCALILIASALFLSAESPKPSPVPSPRNAVEQGETARLGQQQPQQQPSPIGPTNSAHSPYLGSEPRQEQKDSNGVGNLLMIAATVVMACATALIAWFNFQLVGVTKEMQVATKAAADATKAALHVNRPFLLVTDVKCGEVVHNSDGYIPYSFTITLRNFGVGPADMVGYSAGGAPFNSPDVYGQGEPTITYTSNDTPLRELISPGEITDKLIPKVRFDLYDDMLGDIQKHKKRIGINGQIRYRGAAPEQVYWTRFFWWCFINDRGEPLAIRRALRPDLNDHS